MFELFLNPANVMIGGALISSPILIHLINRMRYRRIRWAAMEFLLKSQKRNRRRLIIEQLILLFLRILLVLLTALLLARFLGFSLAGIFQPRNSTHVVILDDRLSTGDHWRTEEGEDRTAFQVGKQLIEKELVKTLSQARTPQRLVLFRLSEPGKLFDVRLNDETLRDLGKELAQMDESTFQHLDLAKGVAAAQDILGKSAQDQRFLHIVSDFRQLHWTEPEATELLKTLNNLAKEDVRINLLDTAHPYRSESQKVPLYHDNLAVVELRPETRVAAEGIPIQFTVAVANNSASERKNVRVTVKVEGTERPEGSLTVLSLPPGRTEKTFQVSFVRPGHNEITASLEPEEAGLPADNIRYATIEVRPQVPVLIIDGDLSNGNKPKGDTYHLRSLLTAARGFKEFLGTLGDLERPNLDQYPSIYLLNVQRLTSEKALKNLESYVAAGGSVAFFLGEKVDPDYYNKNLYAAGKGLFPAPLAERPSPALSEEEKQERRLQNLVEPTAQIFFRDEKHPIFAEVALKETRPLFNFLSIDRHYPVPRLKWDFDPGRVEELVTLPNEKAVADYQATAQDILDSLPVDDPAMVKYRPVLERHRRAIRDTLTGKALYAVANALEALLQDRGEPNDPDKPNLVEFWEQTDPKIQALYDRVKKFRETVQYGDPLVIAARYGKGRVVAFLTTAGKNWNDWAGGSPASVTYPVVMLELQKYLTGGDATADRAVGTPLQIEVPSSRYETKMHCYLQQGPQEGDPAKAAAADNKPATRAGMKDLGEQLGAVQGELLTFVFDRANRPGVYHFDLNLRADMGAEPKTETRAMAFNVDTRNESDLRRVSRDELEKVGRVHTPGAGSFNDLIDRQSDLSESAWLYLLFLVVLVAEQALAVHLSFHLKGNEAQLPAQAVRPQAA
jgi:hypothetical protein